MQDAKARKDRLAINGTSRPVASRMAHRSQKMAAATLVDFGRGGRFCDEGSAPPISFCTGCMGRLHHLRETYPDNIIINAFSYPAVEFVLLDYNSQDGLARWVDDTLHPFIEIGLVRFLQERTRIHWNMSHAKNVTHLAGSGLILCNLDADNRIVPDFARHLCTLMSGPSAADIVIAPAVSGTLDIVGRIAIRRSHFLRIGGYNEDFKTGYGYEDIEFMTRARRANLREGTWDCRYAGTVPHGEAERARHLAVPFGVSMESSELVLADSDARGTIQANCDGPWGRASLWTGACHGGPPIEVDSTTSPPSFHATPHDQVVGAIRTYFERQAKKPRDAHVTGVASLPGGGKATLRMMLERKRSGVIVIAKVACECDIEELFVAGSMLAIALRETELREAVHASERFLSSDSITISAKEYLLSAVRHSLCNL